MIHPNFDERVAPARIDPEARLSFTYDTLATDIPEIRLMILQASPDESAPVECTLEIGNLDRELEFKALSYVWGDPAITEEVFVDGCASAVTPNLVSALRQIRSAFGKTVIWVDAICKRYSTCPSTSKFL